MKQEIQDLFRSCGHRDDRLAAGVEALAGRFGSEVYREILWHLVGKAFDAETAQGAWEAAALRRREPAPNLGLRPALLDYLQQVAGVLNDPRILEADLLDELRRAAISDGLTGLFNQTHFKLTLEHLLGTVRDGAFAVVLLDLDHFKDYNDRCGHLAGDRALARVAGILRKTVRQGDLAARYGGEEFVLLLHRVSARQVHDVAERIRTAVAEEHFPGQTTLPAGNLTISGGFTLCAAGDTVASLLGRADRELYRAKRTRNAIRPDVGNLRRASRRDLRSVIEYAPAGTSTFRSGLSFDLSRTGLALGCDRPLEPGTLVRLLFRRPFWRREVQVDARVRHVQATTPEGLVRLGLEFLQPREDLALEANPRAGET